MVRTTDKDNDNIKDDDLGWEFRFSVPISGTPYWKRNSYSVFDSGYSARIFF